MDRGWPGTPGAAGSEPESWTRKTRSAGTQFRSGRLEVGCIRTLPAMSESHTPTQESLRKRRWPRQETGTVAAAAKQVSLRCRAPRRQPARRRPRRLARARHSVRCPSRQISAAAEWPPQRPISVACAWRYQAQAASELCVQRRPRCRRSVGSSRDVDNAGVLVWKADQAQPMGPPRLSTPHGLFDCHGWLGPTWPPTSSHRTAT